MNKKTSVFLGGTCGDSTWRSVLIPLLDEHIEYFNPQLPPGAWNREAQEREEYHREADDICLYVITPEGEGFYSYVEVTDDSNKRPEKTVLCILPEANGKAFSKHEYKCALKTAKLVHDNGATVVESLDEVANYINSFNKAKKLTIKK